MTPFERIALVALTAVTPTWRNVLRIVQPDTPLRWHRACSRSPAVEEPNATGLARGSETGARPVQQAMQLLPPGRWCVARQIASVKRDSRQEGEKKTHVVLTAPESATIRPREIQDLGRASARALRRDANYDRARALAETVPSRFAR